LDFELHEVPRQGERMQASLGDASPTKKGEKKELVF
jgi:hypothetical protein